MSNLQEGCSRVSVSVLDMDLQNPIIVAAGPLTDSLEGIKNCFKAGSGAVVTKTMFFSKPRKDISGRNFIKILETGCFNTATYSARPLSQWIEDLEELNSIGLPVIPSIYADSPENLAHLAKKIAASGSKAIELGISCPNDCNRYVPAANITEYTKALRKAVDLPISVKLSSQHDIIRSAKAALESGADAISISDALPAVKINIERHNIEFDGPVGYSGSGIKPIVLYSIYILRKSGITCPIIGIGGITNASDVLEFIQLGACAVQACTVFLESGIQVLGGIVRELILWCKKNKTNIRDMEGIALKEWGDGQL